MIAPNGNYWQVVREIMAAFPQTLESTSYGTPAYKVNKNFCSGSRKTVKPWYSIRMTGTSSWKKILQSFFSPTTMPTIHMYWLN
jgi:hypothetical protein